MNFTKLTEEEIDDWYLDYGKIPQLMPPEHNPMADIP